MRTLGASGRGNRRDLPPPDQTAGAPHPPRDKLIVSFTCCALLSITKVDPPTVPTIVRQWVQATPMPTLLVTQDLEPLAVNEAFTKLLSQLALAANELLRGHLSEDGSVHAPGSDLFTYLEKGKCAVRHLTVGEHEHYTFHLIKLNLSASNSCICCMLVPNGEPWTSHPTEFLSFEENQRSYITCVLQRTDGKVSGPGGAAEILELHPQTLFSKLKQLGIKR